MSVSARRQLSDQLESARRNLALCQHHDAITGTSTREVMGDYMLRWPADAFYRVRVCSQIRCCFPAAVNQCRGGIAVLTKAALFVTWTSNKKCLFETAVGLTDSAGGTTKFAECWQCERKFRNSRKFRTFPPLFFALNPSVYGWFGLHKSVQFKISVCWWRHRSD